MTEEATPKPILISRNTNENDGISESIKPRKQVTFKRIVEYFTYTENWKMEMDKPSSLLPDESLQLGGSEIPKRRI
ncbi:uncharacterized protein Dwil_GK19006 [Drosophila willistoni]|uniref:Uncharacterized protein n=1 Tax=Drosophila willistoni TaxID=7260 RepID=B4MIW9_DROWI|nr:uncharacterized protein LOC6637979 [Drosophila willistoni]EDW72058.2 uncharacterized protein Dwil_GK19006 [Drosophila willistoni]